MSAIQKTLIVITGPTAVGKTALAITLAKTFHTEIVSADSRQIFRELTIGTAKPAAWELEAVPHHFINSHSINEHYDAAQFGNEALQKIKELFTKYDHAVLCGGSGLYIKAVVDGFDDIPSVPDEIREDLVANFNQYGVAWLQEKLKTLDPVAFTALDVNNPHRLMRALEVKIGTGRSILSFRTSQKLRHDFNIIKIGLELPREALYKRIDERMDAMIRDGLFDEAAALYPFKTHNALQTVGYQEIFDFMDGLYDKEEAIRLLKRNSRRYAKRQLTWFKRDAAIKWFSPDNADKILRYVTEASAAFNASAN